MAIDDNTSYELTGAQVKDLANKIKAKAADNTFVGATSAAPGSKGLVPQPQAGDNTKFLAGDGSWGAVTSSNIDWSTFTYSASEQRVGTWVNGKPVYKKTVATGAMPNNVRKQVAHGISNLDFIISMSGAAYGSSTFVPIPYTDTTASSSVGLFADSNNIILFTGANMSYLKTSYVTLYYTKTTD